MVQAVSQRVSFDQFIAWYPENSEQRYEHVFGRDAMYWYRAEQRLGKFSLVGTTVKDPQQLPLTPS